MTTFDGETLLQQQSNLLATSLPTDITFINFLRIRLNAQQKLTIQRNKWQKLVQAEEQSHSPSHERVSTRELNTSVVADSLAGTASSVNGPQEKEAPSAVLPEVLDSSTQGVHSLDDRPAMASGKLNTSADENFKEIQLEECPYCGRKFSAARVDKHVSVCQKQTQKEEGRESMRRSVRADKPTTVMKSRPTR